MKAFIGVGSNKGNRIRNIENAVMMLGDAVIRSSSLYETEAEGMEDAPMFINAVLEIETDADPFRLLEGLEIIERKLGREGKSQNKPRTIDLDILLYGNMEVRNEKLIIPHPRMNKRSFVLKPLLELIPAYENN